MQVPTALLVAHVGTIAIVGTYSVLSAAVHSTPHLSVTRPTSPPVARRSSAGSGPSGQVRCLSASWPNAIIRSSVRKSSEQVVRVISR